MLAVAVARRAREYRHHHLRPEPPDHVQHVGQQRVARPEPKRFLGRLGVPEIERAGEELAGAVELAGGEGTGEHTSEIPSLAFLVCPPLLLKKKKETYSNKDRNTT